MCIQINQLQKLLTRQNYVFESCTGQLLLCDSQINKGRSLVWELSLKNILVQCKYMLKIPLIILMLFDIKNTYLRKYQQCALNIKMRHHCQVDVAIQLCADRFGLFITFTLSINVYSEQIYFSACCGKSNVFMPTIA